MLGYPTANLDPCAFKETMKDVSRGVYIGFARVAIPSDHKKAIEAGDNKVYMTMISLGTSPQFDDQEEDTVEAYICHEYTEDFYGLTMELVICGYIRSMAKFNSLEELIAMISNDVRIGKEALNNQPLINYYNDSFFFSPSSS